MNTGTAGALQRPIFESVPPTAPFAVALLGLGALPGVGMNALVALNRMTNGEIGDVWTLEPDAVVKGLLQANIPKAVNVTDSIFSRRAFCLEEGERQTEALRVRSVTLLAPSQLPGALRNVPGTPPWLFVQGNVSALHTNPKIAIVGTRDPSANGRAITRRLASALRDFPVTVVSGLANGIDAEAHSASLAAGLTNVAFLGHGIDHTYPRETAPLRERIVAEGGAVATEFLPGEPSAPRHFVARNRLQAALSDWVIIGEGGDTSGTAHTVRFARLYKRRLLGLRWPGVKGLAVSLEQAGETMIDRADLGSQRFNAMLLELVKPYHPGFDVTARAREEFWRRIDAFGLPPAELLLLQNALLEQAERRLEQHENTAGVRFARQLNGSKRKSKPGKR